MRECWLLAMWVWWRRCTGLAAWAVGCAGVCARVCEATPAGAIWCGAKAEHCGRCWLPVSWSLGIELTDEQKRPGAGLRSAARAGAARARASGAGQWDRDELRHRRRRVAARQAAGAVLATTRLPLAAVRTCGCLRWTFCRRRTL